ncbi:MAG: hypothetical protein C0473_01070 [Cyanobacteria bacterium DS3.002]|nr:hypothetical protein [Cyanobacteria bacterium DS3.002]
MTIATISREQIDSMLASETNVHVRYAAYVYHATSSNWDYAHRVLETIRQQQQLYAKWMADASLPSTKEICRSHRGFLNHLHDEQCRVEGDNKERLFLCQAQKIDAQSLNDSKLLQSAENELLRLENEMRLETAAPIIDDVIFAGLKKRLFNDLERDKSDPTPNVRRFLQEISAAVELKVLQQISRVSLAEQHKTQAREQLFRFNPDLSN